MKKTVYVLAALHQELVPFVEFFGYEEGQLSKKKALLIELPEVIIKVQVLGFGKSVNKGLRRIFFEDQNIDFVFFVGFCGGVNQKLNVGDIVCPEKVQAFCGKSIELRQIAKCFLNIQLKQHGVLETCDCLAKTQRKREILEHDKNVVAVDMESYYVADFLTKKSIPFLVFKAVSDEFAFKFTGERYIFRIFTNKNWIQRWLFFCANPLDYIRLRRLKNRVSIAAINLAREIKFCFIDFA